LQRIEAARQRKPRIKEERITLAHGAGGKATHILIDALFLEAFRNPLLEALEDQAVLDIGGARIAFTTDSYVVSPIFFPGGDIGDLDINGTVNDLAMSGARPLYLSCGFILEEGFPVADLQRIAASMAAAAGRGGVATILNEMAKASNVAVVVEEHAVPVRPEVNGACEILGIDPLYVACEGRFVAVVDGGAAGAAVAALRSQPGGEGAAVIGRV